MRPIVLDLDLQQLLPRENVGHPAVFGTSIAPEEGMLETIHQTVDRLDLDVLSFSDRFRGHIVVSEDDVVRVELHDCEQGPLDPREVAFFHLNAAVDSFYA